MSIPMFRGDAKSLGDEIAAVLAAPFPAERAGSSLVEQACSDGLTYIERLERAASMLAGEQRRVMAVQVNLATTEPGPFGDAEHAEWSAYADIALTLQLACRTADARIDDARTLYERLPLTLAKLRSGHISLSKALVMVEQTADLDAPECAQVEKVVLENTNGTRGNFKRRVRSAVQRIDPDAVVRKRARARQERQVVTFEGEDGLNAINALIPAEDAARVWKVIDEHARTLRLPGDERSIAALRADAFVDLIVNAPDGPRVTWQLQAIVPVGTLFGISEDDGNIPGHGPIPPGVVRDIAADADHVRRLLVDPDTGALRDANATRYRPGDWAGRMLTDPDTSHLLDAHPDRYRPGDALERFIKLRDQHCRWPGCRQPAARCDVDHTIPHHKGGLTIRRNLACFCRRHHRIKQLAPWQIVQAEQGELTFTSPTGRIYRTRPPNPDGTEWAPNATA